MAVHDSGPRSAFETTPHGIYRFDQFELDTLKGCLRADGAEIHLRHKTFQVLRLLIEQRDRTVTKQELWERVWPGSAVTDDALVQCVKDIRRALGDDHRDPRYVRTQARLGYRFIAQLAPDPARQAEVDASPQPISVPQPARRPARRIVPQLAFAALVVVAVAASASFGLRGRADAIPRDPGKTSVAVMYLSNESGAPELEWLRHGLADMLISGLSRSGRLALFGRQQLDATLSKAGFQTKPSAITLDAARNIAAALHADTVILGAYGRLGDRLRADVQMYSTATGGLLASERLVAERPEDILTEVDLLSLRLAARLGTPQPGGRLVDVMTDNLEAYRAYSLGVEHAHELKVREAIALFERAAQLDPQFAMAYARIGYTYGVTWGRPDQARPYLQKAFALSQRLTPRDRLNITAWYAVSNADFAQAIRLYRQIVAEYPYDVEAYLRLGRLLQGEEQFEEAVAVLQRGLAIDPHRPELYNQLAGTHNDWRRHDGALEYARKYVELAGSENAYDTLGLTYIGLGDYGSARAAFERALAIRPDFEVARVHLANTLVRQGKYEAAAVELRRYVEQAPSDGERQRGLGYLAWLARLRGRPLEERQHLEKLPREGSNGLLTRIYHAFERGDPQAAEALRKEALGPVAGNRGARMTRRFELQVHGTVALKSGRTDDAIRIFRQLLKHPAPIWSVDDLETTLADALLEAGRYAEAAAEYRRITTQWPQHGPARYGLAEAYRLGGRTVEAFEAYRSFLDTWAHADGDIPIVVNARRYVDQIARR